MTLDLDCQRANGRKAFPGVNWQFPVQLSRVVGLTGHVNDRSAKAYLGAFKGALKGWRFHFCGSQHCRMATRGRQNEKMATFRSVVLDHVSLWQHLIATS